MSKAICIIAYSEPPERWGFRLSKAGTSWWIRIAPERVPACLRALKDRGIKGRAIWSDADPRNPPPSVSTVKGKKGLDRPRGRAARATYDAVAQQRRDTYYIKETSRQAEAIAETHRLNEMKRRRLQADGAKRKADLASQARQRLAREQEAHARGIAAAYLLSHPIGNA